jgi:hypothetical protein
MPVLTQSLRDHASGRALIFYQENSHSRTS